MKGSFNEQFASVHELCLMVLTASTRPDLIKATLMTLNSFLGWVPLGYILESNMVDILLGLMTKEGYRYVDYYSLALRLSASPRLSSSRPFILSRNLASDTQKGTRQSSVSRRWGCCKSGRSTMPSSSGCIRSS